MLYCSLPPFLFSLSLSISHSISTNQMSNDGLHWQLFLSTNTRRVAAEKEHIFVVDRWQGTYFTKVKIDMNKDIVPSLLGKHFIIDDMQFSFTLELLMREYTTVFLITNFIHHFYFYFTNTMKTLFCNYLILCLICMNNIWIEVWTLLIHCSS